MTQPANSGNMSPMTNVTFISTDAPDPTKAFADAAWVANPRISPSSWRVAQGYTFSKLTFDARASLKGWPKATAAGCNTVLLSAVTAPLLTHKPAGTVAVLETASPTAIPEGMDIVLTLPNPANWLVLEQAVKDNHIAFYGLTSTGWDDLASHLTAADDAAATVWGRRKRSGLKALMVPFNLAEQHAARELVTYHNTEAVSPLELAARRNMLVLADRPTLWHGPWGLADILTHPEIAPNAQLLLTTRLPTPWKTLPPNIQAWALASSMAGITSTVITSPAQNLGSLITLTMEQPDIVDMAAVLNG